MGQCISGPGQPKGAVCGVAPRPAGAEGHFLRVITVNDVYELTNYPRLRSCIQMIKGQSQDCTVLPVLPGDFLSPCTLTSLDRGVSMMKGLNMSGIEYVMFGNHEFDLTPGELQKRINEFKGVVVNSNVITPEFTDSTGKPLPKYIVLEVGTHKVAMAAFLLDDMAQFAPIKPMPVIKSPQESVDETWKLIKQEDPNIDLFLPMVHLNIQEDRLFGKHVSAHAELGSKTPIILAAHDHEIYIEQVDKTMVFKTGADAKHIGIVDLYWTADGSLRRHVHLLDANDYPCHTEVQAFKDQKDKMLTAMMDVPITTLPDIATWKSHFGTQHSGWATNRVRFEPSALVSWLLTMVKGSMPGIDLVMLQGGNVRGNTPKYEPGPWKYADLWKEFAFTTDIGRVSLPGHIIEHTIAGSRSKPGEANGFYLHVDSDAYLTPYPDVKCKTIGGETFDPNKIYAVATYQFLLNGMGDLEPMLSYVKQNDLCPPLDQCQPIKHFCMQTCMKHAWCELLLDDEEPKKWSEEELHKKLQEAFDRIDSNKDGRLDTQELKQFIDEKHKGITKPLLNLMIGEIDVDGDGKISRDELHAIVHC